MSEEKPLAQELAEEDARLRERFLFFASKGQLTEEDLLELYGIDKDKP